MRPYILLVICIALAGCDSNPQSPEEGPSGTTSGTVTPAPTCEEALCEAPDKQRQHIMELFECSLYFVSVPVDPSKLDALLPEGYDYGSDPVGTVGLDATICKSVVIDNRTVLEDVSMYSVDDSVSVPGDVAREGVRNLYYFEVCVDKTEIQEVFQTAGFTTCNGSVSATLDGVTLTMSFNRDSTTVYALQAVVDSNPAPVGTSEGLRFHQATATVRTWLDDEVEQRQVGIGVGPATLAVTGGLLSTVMAHPGDQTAGHMGMANGQSTLYLPEQLVPT
jgi:hypothetical protein